METPSVHNCQECGTPLDYAALDGLCPQCVALDFFRPESQSPAGATPSRSEALPSFGDYELLEEIARGGMGVVYRARQISLRRVVAVKMVGGGPLAGDEAIARFKVEATAAASLQHPNIVAIHEIGEHQGQHYFSMDYVDGPTLGALVREGPLPAKRAATYVRRVAEAVHYAHGRGVLHRDLKPSNVLIDDADQPRVTDFGLAKRLGNSERETRNSELTQSGAVMGTPAFMAPEQADRKFGEVGVRCDVYGLGAMLYHLLTGRAPFTGQSPTEILTQVLQNDPVAPRLLNPALPLDLETICLKCLEKEPARRFGSAQALSEELGRFLRDEPIIARPVGAAEKLGRWCRRKPALASALGACLAILLAGIGATLWQLRQTEKARAVAVQKAQDEETQRKIAEQARQQAEEAKQSEANQRAQAEAEKKKAQMEARKSELVVMFLTNMLSSARPSVARGRDTKMLRDILDNAAKRLGEALPDQPEVEAKLRKILGDTYQTLGEYVQAEAMFRRELELWQALRGPDHPSVAIARDGLGGALFDQGRHDEGVALLRQALALLRKRVGDGHRLVAPTLYNLAVLLDRQRKPAEAEPLARELLELEQLRVGHEHTAVADALAILSRSLTGQNHLVEAEAMARESLRLRRKLLREDDPDIANSRAILAKVLKGQNRLAEAEALHREELELQKKLLGPDDPDLAVMLGNLASVLEAQGKRDEAEALFRQTLATLQKKLGPAHPDVATSLGNLAAVLQRQGKWGEAEPLLRERLQWVRTRYGPDSTEAAAELAWLAEGLLQAKQFVPAEAAARECLAIRDARLPGGRRALYARSLLGAALLGQKRYAEAEPLLLAAYEATKKPDNSIPPDQLKSLLESLVRLYEAQDHPTNAADWQRQLDEFQKGRRAVPP